MNNAQYVSSNDYSHCRKQATKQTQSFETSHQICSGDEEQKMLDILMNTGFTWEESVLLLSLREHLYDNTEMHQRITDDQRMCFARWLYLNGEMHEDIIEDS